MQALVDTFHQQHGCLPDSHRFAMEFAANIILVRAGARPGYLKQSQRIDVPDLVMTDVGGWTLYTRGPPEHRPESRGDTEVIGRALGYHSPWSKGITDDEIFAMPFIKYIMCAKVQGVHGRHTIKVLLTQQRVRVEDLDIVVLWDDAQRYKAALAEDPMLESADAFFAMLEKP